MLRPSTAPRWKIAIRIFCRACAACAARAMNAGVKPRLTSAALPFLRKMRRVIMIGSSSYVRYRFWNSGDPSVSATSCCGVVARAMVWRVASDAPPPSSVSIGAIDRRLARVRRERAHVHLQRPAAGDLRLPLQLLIHLLPRRGPGPGPESAAAALASGGGLAGRPARAGPAPALRHAAVHAAARAKFMRLSSAPVLTHASAVML